MNPSMRRWYPGRVIGVLVLAVAPTVVPTAAGADSAVPSDPVFVALLTDGSTIAGRLARVEPGSGITLVQADETERSVAVAQLVKLTRTAAPVPVGPEGGVVLLPGNDRLARCLVGVAGDTSLRVQTTALGPLAIPLDALAGLILQRPPRTDAAEALEGRLKAEPGAAERLWLANGDRVDGLFAGLSEREVAFQPPTGRVGFARAGVLALGFNPKLVAARFDRGQLVGPTRFGVEVRIPIGEVAQVRVGGSSVVYLSDREADRVVYESYLGPTRPYRRNGSVAGGPVRLGPSCSTSSTPGRDASRPRWGWTTRPARSAASPSGSSSTANRSSTAPAWGRAIPRARSTSRSRGENRWS